MDQLCESLWQAIFIYATSPSCIQCSITQHSTSGLLAETHTDRLPGRHVWVCEPVLMLEKSDGCHGEQEILSLLWRGENCLLHSLVTFQHSLLLFFHFWPSIVSLVFIYFLSLISSCFSWSGLFLYTHTTCDNFLAFLLCSCYATLW